MPVYRQVEIRLNYLIYLDKNRVSALVLTRFFCAYRYNCDKCASVYLVVQELNYWQLNRRLFPLCCVIYF